MLQNRIVSANALLILVILTAKVSCQMNQRFGTADMDENQYLELDPSRNNNRKIFGRQLNQKLDLDLMRFNQRNADNSMYRTSAAASGAPGGATGGRPSSPIGAIVVPPPPVGGGPPPGGPGGGPFGSIKVKIPSSPQDTQESPSPSPSPSPVEPSSAKQSDPSASSSNVDDLTIKEKENEEKLHGLQKLIQQLYVAQAQVQLEANEIQRAQGVAAAAQQSLEEASNNVRVITAALHAAQQTVASAAIRAQTAQLQLAAHDQLLFAARQRVDALSAQIVSVKAEEGIQPTKMIVDVQALLNKLKAPLPDAQKPTPVPSILGENGGGQETRTGGVPSKESATGSSDTATIAKAKSKTIHSAPYAVEDDHFPNFFKDQKNPLSYSSQNDLTQYENTQQKSVNDPNQESRNLLLRESKNLPENDGQIQQIPVNEETDENFMTKGNDIMHYADSLLKDNSDDNVNVEETPDNDIKKEISILNENELRNLVDFILAMHHDQEPNENLVIDNKKVFEKHADQKYINDFLNTIKNSQLKDQKYKELKVNEVINRRDKAPEKNMEQKEKEYDADSEAIFNMEKAFDLNSENFQESLP